MTLKKHLFPVATFCI